MNDTMYIIRDVIKYSVKLLENTLILEDGKGIVFPNETVYILNPTSDVVSKLKDTQCKKFIYKWEK